MATIIIKDWLKDNQAAVNDDHELLVAGTFTATDASVGPTGQPVPLDASFAGAQDPSGNLVGLKVNSAGALLTTGGSGGSSTVPWANFGQSTPDQVTVTDTSTVLLNSNPNRVFARFVNNTSQLVYIQYSIAAAWKTGFPLPGNSMYIIKLDELYTGAINAIAQTGVTASIDVIEGVV